MNTSLLKLFGATFAMVASSVFAQQTVEIPSLEGETWWGGAVALGGRMPYMEPIQEFDLETRMDNGLTSPVLLSNKGRYIWSEKPFAFSASAEELKLKSKYEQLAVQEGGKNLRDAYRTVCSKYFKFDGRYPEEIFFKEPQYNTWIELMYNQNQKDVLAYAHNIVNHDFPAGILMIDDNWQRYYGNFDFKLETFPDAKAMTDELHRMGFKVMVWISPFVSPDSPEYRELKNKGYLVKDRKGQPAIIKWWNGCSASYDMTNPEAVKHLEGLLKEAQQKYGIDGFKFDAGDANFYPSDRQLYYDKNALSVDHTRAWTQFAIGFPFHEMRAGWKMGGQPVVQRLGDKDCSWKALQSLIPQMMATGLLGYPYTCPDMIGGGQIQSFIHADLSKIDQELIVRSAQVHALMPMMQFSVAPWRILTKENLEIVKEAARLHESFAPYILECVHNAAETGEPIVRHMEYEFPNEGFATCKDQYMLGAKYMVTPMVVRGTTRTVKFPKGLWQDENGRKYKGGRTVTIEVPLNRLPYFKRLK